MALKSAVLHVILLVDHCSRPPKSQASIPVQTLQQIFSRACASLVS